MFRHKDITVGSYAYWTAWGNEARGSLCEITDIQTTRGGKIIIYGQLVNPIPHGFGNKIVGVGGPSENWSLKPVVDWEV